MDPGRSLTASRRLNIIISPIESAGDAENIPSDRHTLVMILFNLLASSLLFLASIRHVKASALTTIIAANERLCFYADVDKAGEKLGVSAPT